MDASALDAHLVDVAAIQGGVVTTAELLALGATPDQVSNRLGRLLTRYVDGVYFVGSHDAARMDLAAARAIPGGVLSHSTAAALHGLPCRRDPTIHVLSDRRSTRRLAGVRLHATRALPAVDRSLLQHRPVTTIERTVCDLAATASARWLRQLIEAAITSGAATPTSMQACILSYRRRGRTGSRLLGLTTDEIFGDDPLPMSQLESRAEDLLRRESFPPWVRQFAPPWHDGIRGVVDIAWPAERVILELDGRRWHTMTQAFEEDRRRDQLAVAAGWSTVRASWQQVTARPDELIAALRAALSPSRPLPRPSVPDVPGSAQEI